MVVKLKSGASVRVRRRGDDPWTDGRIALASDNGLSLAIWLDGAVRGGDGYIAVILPLIFDPVENAYIGVVIPDRYELEAAP
jgi:hypothetical protein